MTHRSQFVVTLILALVIAGGGAAHAGGGKSGTRTTPGSRPSSTPNSTRTPGTTRRNPTATTASPSNTNRNPSATSHAPSAPRPAAAPGPRANQPSLHDALRPSPTASTAKGRLLDIRRSKLADLRAAMAGRTGGKAAQDVYAARAKVMAEQHETWLAYTYASGKKMGELGPSSMAQARLTQAAARQLKLATKVDKDMLTVTRHPPHIPPSGFQAGVRGTNAWNYDVPQIDRGYTAPAAKPQQPGAAPAAGGREAVVRVGEPAPRTFERVDAPR